MLETFEDLIGNWPRPASDGRTRSSIAAFAADIGVSYSTAQSMRRRGSVAVDFWPSVIEAAKRHGHTLTHDDLVRMRERRRTAKRRSRAQMAA